MFISLPKWSTESTSFVYSAFNPVFSSLNEGGRTTIVSEIFDRISIAQTWSAIFANLSWQVFKKKHIVVFLLVSTYHSGTWASSYFTGPTSIWEQVMLRHNLVISLKVVEIGNNPCLVIHCMRVLLKTVWIALVHVTPNTTFLYCVEIQKIKIVDVAQQVLFKHHMARFKMTGTGKC